MDRARYAELGAPEGCSRMELDKRLRGIRWRLDCASFGTLKRADVEVPRLLVSMLEVTKWLAWGERHDGSVSELFRKHTMLEAFVCALRLDACPLDIRRQALQSLAILLPEMQRGESLRYLLTVLNPLFETPPDLKDEDVCSYFTCILKGLAMRLDIDNISYCIVAPDGSEPAVPTCDIARSSGARFQKGVAATTSHIPVLDCAMSLAFHAESMVRTAARTVVLTILRIKCSSANSISATAVSNVLVPRFASVATTVSDLCPPDCKAPRKWRCTWMWADTITGDFAQINPLRWSGDKNLRHTIEELSTFYMQGERPIYVRLAPHELGTRQRRYSQASDAIDELQVLEHPPKMEDLLDFAGDMFDLNIPPVTGALQKQGFARAVVEGPAGASASRPYVFNPVAAQHKKMPPATAKKVCASQSSSSRKPGGGRLHSGPGSPFAATGSRQEQLEVSALAGCM